jgi:hypothetical protein
MPDLPFRDLLIDDASSEPVAGVWVARTVDDWHASWRRLSASRRPPPPPPPVDWTTDMAVVFALGTRATGGYTARIERLRTDGTTMRVFVLETRPGLTCGTTQAVTNPFHVVTTTRQELPVEVVSRVEVHECE